MVAESTSVRIVISKLTLELALQSPFADQTTSRIAAELGKNWGAPLEKRFAISYLSWGYQKGFGITNSKPVLHSYHKLIGYWRLKWNATSSILCQVTGTTFIWMYASSWSHMLYNGKEGGGFALGPSEASAVFPSLIATPEQEEHTLEDTNRPLPCSQDTRSSIGPNSNKERSHGKLS